MYVKSEGNKLLLSMDTDYTHQTKSTITGKIVYEKDGVRQEKEFTTIVRDLYMF